MSFFLSSKHSKKKNNNGSNRSLTKSILDDHNETFYDQK